MNKIQKYLKGNNLSQNELAEKLGTSVSRLNLLINGKIDLSIEMNIKLIRLGCVTGDEINILERRIMEYKEAPYIISKGVTDVQFFILTYLAATGENIKNLASKIGMDKSSLCNIKNHGSSNSKGCSYNSMKKETFDKIIKACII